MCSLASGRPLGFASRQTHHGRSSSVSCCAATPAYLGQGRRHIEQLPEPVHIAFEASDGRQLHVKRVKRSDPDPGSLEWLRSRIRCWNVRGESVATRMAAVWNVKPAVDRRRERTCCRHYRRTTLRQPRTTWSFTAPARPDSQLFEAEIGATHTTVPKKLTMVLRCDTTIWIVDHGAFA